MKFGFEFQEALRKEEFPSQWVNSAINYKKLKKCIKRVREELHNLGLDPETLDALWQHVGTNVTDSSANSEQRLLHYQFTAESGPRFVPKLTIALDPKDGSPMDAWLSPDTRRVLQQVGRNRRRETRRPSALPDQIHRTKTANSSSAASVDTSPDRHLVDNNNKDFAHGTSLETTSEANTEDEEQVETIEIPLTSDSEFFQILRAELKALENLQHEEQHVITTDIESLSRDLQVLKASAQKSKWSKKELDIWREIFRLYIESEVFMSDHESDAGARTAEKAEEQLALFQKQLRDINTNPPKPKTKEAHIALERFMNINTTLLRLLKFQELNRKALAKIMKKFDKKTSLHAMAPVTKADLLRNFNTDPTAVVSPHDLARSTAFTISQNLLSLIPQLSDYLCPICCYITYKPVRLRCNHVFCIRCMIRMQRDEKDECPLCRQRVVLEASEDNLDKDLKHFLKKEFRAEVDEKKKENELQAGKELFGEDYQGTHKCVVM